LKEALEQVSVGNEVHIEPLGKRELEGGRTVNLFKVRQRAA
jgi:hypothetical protein